MFGKKYEKDLPTGDEVVQEVVARIQHAAAQDKISAEDVAEHLDGAVMMANSLLKPMFDAAHGRDIEEIAREVQAHQAEYEARNAHLAARENAQQNTPPSAVPNAPRGGEMDLLRKFIGS